MFKRANRESLPYISPLRRMFERNFFSLIAPFRSRIKYYINFFLIWKNLCEGIEREENVLYVWWGMIFFLRHSIFACFVARAWKLFCAHFSAAALKGAVSMRNKKGAQYGKGMISEGIPDEGKLRSTSFETDRYDGYLNKPWKFVVLNQGF